MFEIVTEDIKRLPLTKSNWANRCDPLYTRLKLDPIGVEYAGVHNMFLIQSNLSGDYLTYLKLIIVLNTVGI